MFWILFAPFLFLAVAAGILYPAAAVAFYKIRYRNRISVREILEHIGW